MIGMFRAGGFSVDLTHHVMHAMGSRHVGVHPGAVQRPVGRRRPGCQPAMLGGDERDRTRRSTELAMAVSHDDASSSARAATTSSSSSSPSTSCSTASNGSKPPSSRHPPVGHTSREPRCSTCGNEWMTLDGGSAGARATPDEEHERRIPQGGWHMPYFDDMSRNWVVDGHAVAQAVPAWAPDVREPGVGLAARLRRGSGCADSAEHPPSTSRRRRGTSRSNGSTRRSS